MRLRKKSGTQWVMPVRTTLQRCAVDRLLVCLCIWATTNALELLETQLDSLAQFRVSDLTPPSGIAPNA